MTNPEISNSLNLAPRYQAALDHAVDFLKANLRDNLYSLILYGSAVRGNLDPHTSDLNLLIVLEASTATAHQAIGEIVHGQIQIDPFVVERGGMPRAARVFALKFLSIRRNYLVLHGADPLRDLEVPPELQMLLTEQEVRNLRMRLVYAFVTAGAKPQRYQQFLRQQGNRFALVLSDVLYAAGIKLPKAWPERVPLLTETFGADATVLNRLSGLKGQAHSLTPAELFELHSQLVELFGKALSWMEQRWPRLPL